jgi:hypothetical protein
MVSKDEDMQIQKDAYAHGMNISAYLRWLVEKERNKTKKRSR